MSLASENVKARDRKRGAVLQVVRGVLLLASLLWLAAWAVVGALVGVGVGWVAAYTGAVVLLAVLGLLAMRMSDARWAFATSMGMVALALAFATFSFLPVVLGALAAVLAALLPPTARPRRAA